MSLQVPIVGEEPGPLYATDVNNSLNIIDSHNHSAGSGVLITPSGININSDLSINGNNVTLIYTTRFQSQASPIPNSSPNIGCVYVAGNELYYNDFSGGHQVQITNNGSVNAGAGSITGLPSGTASVSFSAATYVFQSSTNVAANVDVASVILRNTTAGSNGLTLSPPNALGANYTLTLPSLPGVTDVMTLAPSGNMGTITYDQVGENMTSVGANAIIASAINPNFFNSTYVQIDGAPIMVLNENVSYAVGTLRGYVAGSGHINSGEGFTVVHVGTGLYEIAFTTAFVDFPVGVCNTHNSTGLICSVSAVNSTQMTFAITNSSSSFVDADFMFIIMGQI